MIGWRRDMAVPKLNKLWHKTLRTNPWVWQCSFPSTSLSMKCSKRSCHGEVRARRHNDRSIWLLPLTKHYNLALAPLLTTTYRKCIHTVMSIVIANWKVWPLINYLNFRAVPQSLRVLVMNGASVLWNAFFCAMMA